MPVVNLRRAGAAAAALSGLVLCAAAPAHAATSALPYSCSVAEFPGVDIPLTATFDSALDEGEVVEPGDVDLNPVSGRVVIAEAQVGLLKLLGITTLAGNGTLQAGIDETGQDLPVTFAVGTTPVPATGDLAITFSGATAGPAQAQEEGQYGFFAGDADIALTTNSGSTLTLACTLPDGPDAPDYDDLIDFFEVAAAEPEPTPTPTTSPSVSPTVSPSPVRPVVVQTDAGAAEPTSRLPLAAAGAGSILVLGAASVTARRSAAARRR